MKCRVVVQCLLMVLVLILSGTAYGKSITGKVVGVLDGDTIEVLQDKTQFRIRLYGIDTPEKRQDFGTKAKKFTSDLVFGKPVRVETKATDRYGRIVGIVYVGNVCVNEELVKNGFAWVYRVYCDESVCNGWIEYESQAQVNKIGLWSHADPTPPWDFRKGKRVSKKETPTDQTASVAGVYHGNIKSKVFHNSGCRYFNCKKCTATFNSKAEAVKAGYRSCKLCKPL